MPRQEWVGIEPMGEVFLLTFLFIGLVRSLLARNSRETSLRLAERRKMATICCPHGGCSPVRLEGCVVHDNEGKQSYAREHGRY